MVRHQIEEKLQSTIVRQLEQAVEVVQGAEQGIDISIV